MRIRRGTFIAVVDGAGRTALGGVRAGAGHDHRLQPQERVHQRPGHDVDLPEPEQAGQRRHRRTRRRSSCSTRRAPRSPGSYNSDAAGGIISFTPAERLLPVTIYDIVTTPELKGDRRLTFATVHRHVHDRTGTASRSPRTPTTARSSAPCSAATTLAVGPDGKLYVANGIGEIRRYTLDANGLPTGRPRCSRPSAPSTARSSASPSSPARPPTNLALGVPQRRSATATWPTSPARSRSLTGADPGTRAGTRSPACPGRSKDHMNNGIDFGPDGKLYIAQGSLSGYGAPDQSWGFRAETPAQRARSSWPTSSATPASPAPVNVNTATGYDPGARQRAGEGLRRGHPQPVRPRVAQQRLALRARSTSRPPATRPAGPGGNPPALTDLPAGRDFLARVQQGKYYGHPNPSQGNYVLNGGNPTAAVDPFETPQYPVGVQPDADWTSSRSSTSACTARPTASTSTPRTSSARRCGTSCSSPSTPTATTSSPSTATATRRA